MKGPLDAAVLARARKGDARAFRLLYLHHADAVYVFVRRMLRDATAAEDVLQETFVRVFRALPRFDPAGPGRLSTWIFTIARRVALTALDRGRATRSPELTPESARAMPELRLALEAAIEALPATLRSPFVLYECCGKSYEEVAAIEEIDLGTVKSRLFRARAALQASLGADDDDDHDNEEGAQHEAPRARRAT